MIISLTNLLVFFDDVVVSPAELLLVGDFSFYFDVQNDHHASRFIDILESLDLKEHVTEPTHVSGYTLNLVITRGDATDSFVHNISALEQPISDHKVICFNLNLVKPSSIKKTNKTIKLKDFDFEKFGDVIQRSGLLEEPLDSRYVDEYNSVLLGTVDELAPVTTRTVTLLASKCCLV